MKKSFVFYATLSFFLIGVIYVLVSLSMGRTVFFGKAQSPGTVSLEACRVFASPVISKAGGNDRIRITVFVIDETGRGIANKKVELYCQNSAVCQSSNLIISPFQPSSDTVGQAIFELSSQTAGTFELVASVNGMAVPQTVTVSFQ